MGTLLSSLVNDHAEHTYQPATLSWLGSSRVDGGHIALHKKSYQYPLLPALGPEGVKNI